MNNINNLQEQQREQVHRQQYTLYVLLLESGKYYVGKSRDSNKRIATHTDSNGSAWTKKYHPIKLVETIDNPGPYDEDGMTIKYMSLYGIENVRGGSFCEIKLSDDNISTIKKMINSANDNCFSCGKRGHFINECPNKVNQSLNNNKSRENRESKENKENKENKKCFKCGIEGHFSFECNFVSNRVDDLLDQSDKCFNCLKSGHFIKDCSGIVSELSKIDKKCFRCGKNGHLSFNCNLLLTDNILVLKEINIPDRCFNCGTVGHFVKECPVISGPRGSALAEPRGSGIIPKNVVEINAKTDRKCFKCGKEGHIAFECNNNYNVQINKSEKQLENNLSNRCFNCNKIGHYVKDCPGNINGLEYSHQYSDEKRFRMKDSE